MALGSIQLLTEMSTRSISWGKDGRGVRLINYHHPAPLSRNLGTLTSLNSLGHSRPVTGLICLYLLSWVTFIPSFTVKVFVTYAIPLLAHAQCFPSYQLFLSFPRQEVMRSQLHFASSSSSSSVICQTTGPKPLPKRFLHILRSRVSVFN